MVMLRKKIVLEGEYSTWTQLWAWDFPDGLDNYNAVSLTLSPDYAYILYLDDQAPTSRRRFSVVGLSDGVSDFDSPSGAHYQVAGPELSYLRHFAYNTLSSLLGGGASFSLFAKYVLFLLSGGTEFEVWKDGAKAFTSPAVGDIVTGDTDLTNGLIRYDGKYVLIMTYPSQTLVCFEGS